MKHPFLAKYTDAGIKKTIMQLHERTDLSEAEKERRGNMMIEELKSRGVDVVDDMIKDLTTLVKSMGNCHPALRRVLHVLLSRSSRCDGERSRHPWRR